MKNCRENLPARGGIGWKSPLLNLQYFYVIIVRIDSCIFNDFDPETCTTNRRLAF